MDQRRFIAFLMLSFGVLVLSQLLFPPPPQPDAPVDEIAQQADAEDVAAAEQDNPRDDVAPAALGAEKSRLENAEEALQEPVVDVPLQLTSLGSVDPSSGYRMLVTFTNRGAAIERLELSGSRYRDEHDRSGYLGHLFFDEGTTAELPDNENQQPAVVQVVGAGTPAAKAGLQPGDRIVGFGEDQPIASIADLRAVLSKASPGQVIALRVERDAIPARMFEVKLGRRPLEVIRPELENLKLRKAEVPKDFKSQPSFLTTLDSFNGRPLEDTDRLEIDKHLEDGNWEIIAQDQSSVTFRRALPTYQLEFIKRYSLKAVPTEQIEDVNFPGYDLDLDVELRNVGPEDCSVVYRLDGPNGLPIEGWWYAMRISHGWFSAAGLRDVVVRFEGARATQYRCSTITEGDVAPMGQDKSLAYAAVDAQYFAAALIPKKEALGDVWFSETEVVRLGPEPDKRTPKTYTNVSFEVERRPITLQPGESLEDSYLIFAGPKRPELLKQYYPADATHYNLSDLIYYGWFGAVAKGMLSILHFFYGIVGNYGIAIIMLTLLVRGAMFPISYKQTQNMARMQALKPELDKIGEKYKNDMQKKQQAMQELYAKHKINPLSGCLPLFLQLPIFMGLYRGLMIDVELRQSSLFGPAIRWCSNLAAPDMFYDWSWFMPRAITSGTGIFALGPYLNVLPLVTVALFLVSQKMFMPEPTNEQAAMQQKMMKYMTGFMGFLFFKVASGLCLYFIVSSIWGIVERKLLPKPAEAKAAASQSGKPPAAGGGGDKPKPPTPRAGGSPPTTNGSARTKKRRKAKRKK